MSDMVIRPISYPAYRYFVRKAPKLLALWCNEDHRSQFVFSRGSEMFRLSHHGQSSCVCKTQAKWIHGLEFIDADRPGFLERNVKYSVT